MAKREYKKNPREFFVGSRWETKKCGWLTVVEYQDSKNVMVQFEDGHIAVVQASQIKSGSVKNPFVPSVCGIGFIGYGEYGSKTHAKLYNIWKQVLNRVYDEKHLEKRPSYRGVEVCMRWHNFQNFAEDVSKMPRFDELMNEKPGTKKGDCICIDKDAINPAARIYSPETCTLMTISENSRLPKSI